MRRRLALVSLCTAWLLATGSQWDLLQTFAWARMMLRYAQVLPFREALAETFDGEKPCEICRAVARAKQQQDDSNGLPESRLREKIPLQCQPSRVIVTAAGETPRWPTVELSPDSAEESEPPVPPPRALS